MATWPSGDRSLRNPPGEKGGAAHDAAAARPADELLLEVPPAHFSMCKEERRELSDDRTNLVLAMCRERRAVGQRVELLAE